MATVFSGMLNPTQCTNVATVQNAVESSVAKTCLP